MEETLFTNLTTAINWQLETPGERTAAWSHFQDHDISLDVNRSVSKRNNISIIDTIAWLFREKHELEWVTCKRCASKSIVSAIITDSSYSWWRHYCHWVLPTNAQNLSTMQYFIAESLFITTSSSREMTRIWCYIFLCKFTNLISYIGKITLLCSSPTADGHNVQCY